MVKDHMPIMLMIDLYNKVILPSIEPQFEDAYCSLISKLEYDYFKTREDVPISWKEANGLNMTQNYKSIFFKEEDFCWITLEALNFIYIFIEKHNFEGPMCHIFYFNKTPFVIKLSCNIAYIYTPDDIIE